MRHVSAYLLLSLTSAAVSLAGCADPSPTFVFDAATVAREGGTGGSGGTGGTGGSGGHGGADAGTARDGADARTDSPAEAR